MDEIRPHAENQLANRRRWMNTSRSSGKQEISTRF